jgi:catechol 2,3-dioxygenase-like lactoylglutathione lyase family enzyme
MTHQLRIARPVSDLGRSVDLYRRGLGFRVLGSFDDHAGFDGVMIGAPGCSFHFEFTRCRDDPVPPTPTAEDLVVFYLPDADEWQRGCERMTTAGFKSVLSFNPYWAERGRTFEDPDGYRIVLQRAAWSNDPESAI